MATCNVQQLKQILILYIEILCCGLHTLNGMWHLSFQTTYGAGTVPTSSLTDMYLIHMIICLAILTTIINLSGP